LFRVNRRQAARITTLQERVAASDRHLLNLESFARNTRTEFAIHEDAILKRLAALEENAGGGLIREIMASYAGN
jgi:hypothetical protein